MILNLQERNKMNIEKFRKFLDELEVQKSRDETGKTIYEEGYKYSKNFWNYYNEKQFCIQHMDLDNIKTVCDIGAGVGLLGVLLNYWYDIEVEATDIKSTFDCGLYQQMFAKMRMARHILDTGIDNYWSPWDFKLKTPPGSIPASQAGALGKRCIPTRWCTMRPDLAPKKTIVVVPWGSLTPSYRNPL